MPHLDLDRAKPRYIVVEVRYATAADFYSKRGELIAASETESIRLRLQENEIHIEDRAERCTKKIGLFKASIDTEHIATVGGFLLDVARPWLDSILEILSVDKLRRIGIRQRIIFAYGRTFEDLVQQCIDNMHPASPAAWKAIGGRPSDVGPRLDFAFDDEAAHLFVGPMKREQMTDFFKNEEDLPPVGLFVDWDYYTTTQVPANHLGRFMRQVKDHAQDRIAPFIQSLEG